MSKFEKGMKVEAVWAENGEWYPGVITRVFKNGKVKINFDDGDVANVQPDEVRVIEDYDGNDYNDDIEEYDGNDDKSIDSFLKGMGFIALFVAIIVRLCISFFADTNFFSYKDIPMLEKWFLLICIVLFCFSFWHTFIRKRCPNCDSTNRDLIEEEELDRWLGTKQVSERTAGGKTKTRHVQTTYAKMKRKYKCNNCSHEWTEIDKEEK